MLDELKNCFKNEYQFSHMAGIMNHLANILAIVRLDYVADKESKNKAIDKICEILEAYKERQEDK